LAIIFFISVIAFVFYQKDVENLNIGYGEDFSVVQLYKDSQKTELDNKSINLVFYLSQSCNPCMQLLNLISQLDKLDIFSELKINMIWENIIPHNKIEKYKFKNVENYSLAGKVRLVGVTPYFFIVKDNRVIFTSGPDNMDKIIKNILKYSSSSNIKYDTYMDLLDQKGYTGNMIPIVFLTENCEGCKEWEDFILNTENENLLLILDHETDKFDEYIYDAYGLYKEIFDIKSFPSSFIYQDNDFVEVKIKNLH